MAEKSLIRTKKDNANYTQAVSPETIDKICEYINGFIGESNARKVRVSFPKHEEISVFLDIEQCQNKILSVYRELGWSCYFTIEMSSGNHLIVLKNPLRVK